MLEHRTKIGVGCFVRLYVEHSPLAGGPHSSEPVLAGLPCVPAGLCAGEACVPRAHPPSEGPLLMLCFVACNTNPLFHTPRPDRTPARHTRHCDWVRPPLLQVFEYSFHQLRVRNAEEMRGRLHITFQNEDGIDAGGLTREW